MKELGVEDLMAQHALGIERWGGDGTVPRTARDAMGSVLHSALYNEGLLGYAAAILSTSRRRSTSPMATSAPLGSAASEHSK